MTLHTIQNLVNDDFATVNQLIEVKLTSPIELITKLSHHIIASGGKRLRPLVLLLAARACGYQGTQHTELAVTIEFFHTATLLHDDVVDESGMRRGQQSANSIWGNKPSVLVGDFLFTQAFQIVVDIADIAILNVLSKTAQTMTCGEIKQLSNQYNPKITTTDYLAVIRDKTAILFAAAAQIGALLAQETEQTIQAMHAYGLHLGNAFQLIDDALDYTGASEQLGKQVGDDLNNGKMTLPLIHVLQHGSSEQCQLVSDTVVKGNRDKLPEIIAAIKQTNAIEHTQALAKEEIDHALTALEMIPDSPYKQALIKLAYFAIERDH